MHRRRAAALVLALLLAACSTAGQQPPAAGTRSATSGTSRPSPDPNTAVALVRIAQAFNNSYDHNSDGPVYDRWAPRSQAIITRAEYIRRHAECATAPQSAHVEDAIPGPRGAWLVHYEIGGQQLTDYWFYLHGRWQFDLLRSNPDAARLYRLPFTQYAAQIGCTTH